MQSLARACGAGRSDTSPDGADRDGRGFATVWGREPTSVVPESLLARTRAGLSQRATIRVDTPGQRRIVARGEGQLGPGKGRRRLQSPDLAGAREPPAPPPACVQTSLARSQCATTRESLGVSTRIVTRCRDGASGRARATADTDTRGRRQTPLADAQSRSRRRHPHPEPRPLRLRPRPIGATGSQDGGRLRPRGPAHLRSAPPTDTTPPGPTRSNPGRLSHPCARVDGRVAPPRRPQPTWKGTT